MQKKKYSDILLSVLLIVFIGCVAACNATKKLDKNFTYFQRGLDSLGSVSFKEPIIKANDVLNIQVYSSNLSQEQAAIFNWGNGAANVSGGMNTASPSNNANPASVGNNGYLVSLDGFISLPVIGQIKAAGLTKSALTQTITDKLLNYVKQPNVTVKIISFKVDVLGEVSRPGPVFFNNDRATVLDAIAMSGDIKDDGRRDNILLIREENGKRISHSLDIRSGSIFQSPFFQLQQNDVIYVPARDIKLRSLNSDPNAQRNTALIFASVSSVAVLLQVIIILFKK